MSLGNRQQAALQMASAEATKRHGLHTARYYDFMNQAEQYVFTPPKRRTRKLFGKEKARFGQGRRNTHFFPDC